MTYCLLEVGALVGVPMRPEQIEEMTRHLNNVVAAEPARRENDGEGDPPG